jgi:hypothetical protein
MDRKNLKKEDVTVKLICDELFGEFREMKNVFKEIKQGSVPVKEHANPYVISKLDNMDDWPLGFNGLRYFKSVCYSCTNKEVCSTCKCSLKAFVGECSGMFSEATKEDWILRREINERKRRK